MAWQRLQLRIRTVFVGLSGVWQRLRLGWDKRQGVEAGGGRGRGRGERDRGCRWAAGALPDGQHADQQRSDQAGGQRLQWPGAARARPRASATAAGSPRPARSVAHRGHRGPQVLGTVDIATAEASCRPYGNATLAGSRGLR